MATVGHGGCVVTEGSTAYGLREEGCWGYCYALLPVA